MKLSFSTLGCAERSLDEVVALAKNYGIDALEIRGLRKEFGYNNIVEFKPDAIDGTLSLLADNGIRIILLDTSCMLHNKPNDDIIREGKIAIDTANKLGVPYIRVFGNEIVGDKDECIAHVIEGLKELCDYAASTKVKVLLEVHGDFNTFEAFDPIVSALGDNKNFGILWDIMHTSKTFGERWMEFYERYSSLIYHIHVKDYDKDGLCQIGEGVIPIAPITKHLIDSGFDGYFSLEWERQWHPELCEIEKALEAFVAVMKQI